MQLFIRGLTRTHAVAVDSHDRLDDRLSIADIKKLVEEREVPRVCSVNPRRQKPRRSEITPRHATPRHATHHHPQARKSSRNGGVNLHVLKMAMVMMAILLCCLASTPLVNAIEVSTFSDLSAECGNDNADITVTGDIKFTDNIIISGRAVSITSTTGATLTSDGSATTYSGGMLNIYQANVTLNGLHFVNGSVLSDGGCLHAR